MITSQLPCTATLHIKSPSSVLPAAMGDCNIRVICRFRPINNREKEEWAGRENQQIIKFGGRECVEVALPGQSTQSYTFDFVFPPDATQVCHYLCMCSFIY